jgi:hypothetical protein
VDDWSIEEDLRHIERLLRRDQLRIDLPAEPAPSTSPQPARSSTTKSQKTSGGVLITLRSGVAWLLLCIGLTATVCGLTLLAWYCFGDRGELLIPGLACVAAGQFCLLGGFAIQTTADAPAAASYATPPPASPAEQWLDAHRRIDEILRADLPGSRVPRDRTVDEPS